MEEDVGLLNPTFITYEEFKAKLDIYSGPKENEVKQLLIKFDSVKEQIKNLRIRTELISYYTPIGAAGMYCEKRSNTFFKRNKYMIALSARFAGLTDAAKSVLRKMSLASAIDASVRKNVLLQKVIKLRGICDKIIQEIVHLVPTSKKVTHEIVLHAISLSKNDKKKFYSGFRCEYCTSKYKYGAGLWKHLQECHPNHFENSLDKYYEIANATGDPNVVAALDLLKSDLLGMESFEVLLDEKLKEVVDSIMNNYAAATVNEESNISVDEEEDFYISDEDDDVIPSTSYIGTSNMRSYSGSIGSKSAYQQQPTGHQRSQSNTPSVAAAAVAAAAAAAAGGPSGLGSVGPLGYHQYGGMPAVPSPPAAMVYGSAPGQQLQGAPQAGIYGPFLDSNSQFSLLQVLNGPGNPGRSQFSHFMSPAAHGVGMGHAGLSNLGSLSNAAGGGPFAPQQNLLFQQPPPPSPAASPNATSGGASGGHVPPSVAMNDLYQSSQYRLQGHGPFTGQSQHNNPGPMLISSNNSLGLKSSFYGSIGQGIHGSIGTKSAYQQQPTGHQRSQMYYPYDPNQPLMNMSQVSQMGGQRYLSQSQLLSQQRTAPPPQVQAIQPPPSSFYSGGAGQSNQNAGYYCQQPGGPSLQQMVQGSPAAPGPFSLPGFASQVGLQGYANRAAQQQQQQQQKQQQQQQKLEDVIHQGFVDYMEFKRKKKDQKRYVLYFTSIENDLFQLGINSGENFQTYDKIALQVTGKNLPQYIMSFEDAGLCPLLLSNIKKAGFKKPTPVQKGAISVILAKRDLIACTVTGSGKTAAYLVPVMNILLEQGVIPFHGMVQKPEVLIVAPTRELAIHIHREACKFAYNSALEAVIICGGTVNSFELFNLQAGCNILVATVGHLKDCLDRGVFDFSYIQFLILEETDRMLDMGFGPDIEKIATHPTMPPNGVRCTCMFSATFPEEVQTLAAGYMEDYIFVTTSVCGTNMDVKQIFYQCARNEKIFKMMEILYEEYKEKKAMVYVQSKVTADYVAAILCSNSIQAKSIHDGHLQSQRETALSEFKLGVIKVLVVTNVASRSLDITGFDFVLYYDLPNNIENYVQLVRQSGRVGNLGRSISLFDEEKDAPNANKLVSFLIKSNADVPAFLQAMVSGVCGMGYDFNARSEGGGGFASRDMRRFGDKPGGAARPTEAEESWD